MTGTTNKCQAKNDWYYWWSASWKSWLVPLIKKLQIVNNDWFKNLQVENDWYYWQILSWKRWLILQMNFQFQVLTSGGSTNV